MLTTGLSLCRTKAADFLQQRHKMLIGGNWCDALNGETIEVIDPANGQFLTRVPAGNAEDVDLAVKAARSALEGPWGKMSGLERGKLISRFASRIEALAAEIAEIEAIDCGKPVSFTEPVDVRITANTYHYMAGWASKVDGETVNVSSPGEYHAFTVREPVGVVAQIVPWNFPLVLTAYKLAPTLASGCVAIIKPAELTPLSTLRLAQIAEDVGFPPGVINVVTGYGADAGAALAEHPGVDKVAFTGSTEVGKRVARSAIDSVKRITLELGGKSPMVVFPDADLEKAIPALAQAIFFHQGQVCTAGSRLLVHQSIADDVINGILAQARLLTPGHSLDVNTTMGPVVSSGQMSRINRYLNTDAVDVLSAGLILPASGFFIDPRVVVGAHADMPIMREEIFGPVLCASTFNDESLDAVAAMANDTPFGLSASIWTQNLATAHKMVKRVKAGSVWVNTHHFFDPALPFGGFKQSGIGREQGAEAIRTFTENKSVCIAL